MRSLNEITKAIGSTKIHCSLCKKNLLTRDAHTLSRWTFCLGCCKVILRRLNDMEDRFLLPEDEFQKWLLDRF